MTHEYVLQGLICANCAAKIEAAIQSLRGVTSATVNLMTATVKLETGTGYQGDIGKEIKSIVRKYEPDVKVIRQSDAQMSDGHGHSHGEVKDKQQLFLLLAGTAVFAIGFVLRHAVALSQTAELVIFLAAYLILGGGVVLRALKNIVRGQIFDENFLMSIATIGAFAIGDLAEAVAVMLFYQVGEYFQDTAVRQSRKSIAGLMDIRQDFANVIRAGDTIRVAPDTVEIGELIVVKPGEKIPLDGVVVEGESMLDTSALTGESVPRKAKPKDEVLSGCINQSGVLTIEVSKAFGESTVSKIINLVENASSKKAPTENFITTFSRYYTPVVVGLAALLAILPPLFFGGAWSEWINRGLIFLVISCPCALVISIPLGFFGGIGGASKRGVLVKGGNYLEALNNLDIVVFDKTGTLTKGVFEVASLIPAQGFTDTRLLELAAHAESYSNHPIALSIIKAYGKEPETGILSDYKEISGQGIRVLIDGKELLAGNSRLMDANSVRYTPSQATGTLVYIALDRQFAGCIVISDQIKEDSHKAIAGLKEKGIRQTVMLTGDNQKIGQAIAGELGLDQVYTQLLPDQKVEKLELLDGQKRSKGKLAFVGDGINDAPVLARADIGIAMGGLGSDAAIEAADVVLMTDEPSKLLEAIDVANKTKQIVWQNIVFALGVKGVFLLLGALGFATMWEAVFADVGVSVLAILNAMRVLRMK